RLLSPNDAEPSKRIYFSGSLRILRAVRQQRALSKSRRRPSPERARRRARRSLYASRRRAPRAASARTRIVSLASLDPLQSRPRRSGGRRLSMQLFGSEMRRLPAVGGSEMKTAWASVAQAGPATRAAIAERSVSDGRVHVDKLGRSTVAMRLTLPTCA